MEQKINTNMNDGMIMDAAAGAGKTGKGMMIGMIACAVLAVGGIGFGVYEMTQANSAKQQISDLRVEIKNQDGTTTTLETDKIEVKDDTKTVVISDSAVAVNAKEYIYIGEWGIKVKIPDTVKNVGFLYNTDGDYSSLYVSARVTEDNTENPAFNDNFSDMYYNSGGQGAIGIIRNPHKCAMGEIDVEGDPGSGVDCPIILTNSFGKEIGIRYSHPQAIYSLSEEQKEWELKAVGAIQEMLSNPDNYSAI